MKLRTAALYIGINSAFMFAALSVQIPVLPRELIHAAIMLVFMGKSALDILLREKAGFAEQNNISVSCSADLPSDLPVDDLDLCIILANALDNAIIACLETDRTKLEIEITLKVRSQFLLIEVANTALNTGVPKFGNRT